MLSPSLQYFCDEHHVIAVKIFEMKGRWIMFRSMFPQDVFSEMARLHRDLQSVFDGESSIRGMENGTFPVVNVAESTEAVDIYVFAPGLDPAQIELTAEPGVLTIAGARNRDIPEQEERESVHESVHVNERFSGRFRRVISLPQGTEIDRVAADYRDGLLHVCVKRSTAQQPRHIAIQ